MAGPLTPERALGLLRLIEAEPSLLPELGRDEVARWVVGAVQRHPDEHSCLGCGVAAELTFVAEVQRLGLRPGDGSLAVAPGYRWLDLCVPCAAAIRETGSPRG